MILREYQTRAIEDIRQAFRQSKRVFLESPTGSGKTVVFAEITRRAEKQGNNTWIMVPRKELLDQASEKLSNAGVLHGIIAPGFEESSLYNVHVVSKDTWIRRKDSIKRIPRMIIVDEGHLAYERYIDVINTYPNCYFLFVSASPERLDGKPLNNLAPVLVRGPTMKFLIEHQYLAPMEIYSPPIEGLDTVKKSGTEYNAISLDEFLKEKKIYGKAVEHYQKLAHKKSCIVFCRGIEAAKRVAERFCTVGYIFEQIDGQMAKRKRNMLLNAIRTGDIDGLTSCELVTYGLDVPRVECVSMLRPTMSRALYYQMIGRGLRYEVNKKLIVLDHVGNTRLHCPDRMPWEPVDWNYYGTRKKKGETGEKLASIKFCPYDDFRACVKSSCLGCPLNPEQKPAQEFKEIEGQLVQIAGSVPLKERPQIEQEYYRDRLESATDGALDGKEVHSKKISELLEIAAETGRHPMWVYWHLCKNWRTVCIPLLHEIKRQKKYKEGWVKYKKDEIRKRIEERVNTQ